MCSPIGGKFLEQRVGGGKIQWKNTPKSAQKTKYSGKRRGHQLERGLFGALNATAPRKGFGEGELRPYGKKGLHEEVPSGGGVFRTDRKGGGGRRDGGETPDRTRKIESVRKMGGSGTPPAGEFLSGGEKVFKVEKISCQKAWGKKPKCLIGVLGKKKGARIQKSGSPGREGDALLNHSSPTEI